MRHVNTLARAIALALLPAVASAQTVVELQHSGGACSFNTDAAGITYDSNSGHVIASNLGASPFFGACGGGGQVQNPAFTQALNAMPGVPEPATAFTLKWNASNVDYCKTDGTTMPAGAAISGWPLSGQICTGSTCATGSIAANATSAGTYNLTLQCFKNGNPLPAVSSLALSVQNSGGGSCVGHSPVLGTRQPLLQVHWSAIKSTSVTKFDEFFDDVPGAPASAFPQTGNRSVTFAQISGQYVALPFTVPANLPTSMAARAGAFDTNYLPNFTPGFPANNGISYSVSQCAGDFNVPAACKKQWSGQDGDYLTFGAPEISDPTETICKLERGKTYYLNLITTTLDALATPKCAGSSCAVSMSYFRLQ
jgi:hypothetical protein